MSDIDLTFLEISNREEVREPEIFNTSEIEPQFTDGVKEYYVNLGANLPENEVRAILQGMNIDYIFDELSSRFGALNKMWADIRAVVLNAKPTYVTPEHIEEIRADFRQAEALKARFKEIVNA